MMCSWAQGGFGTAMRRTHDGVLDFARTLKNNYHCKIIVFKSRPFGRGLIGLKFPKEILPENLDLDDFEMKKWIKIWRLTSSNWFDSKVWTNPRLIQTGTSDYTSSPGSFTKNFQTDFSDSYLYAVFSEVPIKLFWLAQQRQAFNGYNKDTNISDLWLFKIGSQTAQGREVDCEDGTFERNNYGGVYLNSSHISDISVKLKNVYVLCIDNFFNQCLENTERADTIQESKRVAKYIAPKMFKASMPKMKPVEYVCDCEIDDYYNYEFDECEKTHWSVSIRAYTRDSEDWESFHGYVLKSSFVGKKISSILSDGKEHKMTLVIRFTKKAEINSDVVEIIGMK